MFSVPTSRILKLNSAVPRDDGDFVLYWMTAYRRQRYNFALQHAVDWANELKKPLIVLEALRLRYDWACDRYHQFIIDGMIDNFKAFEKTKAEYVAYVERRRGEGRGLVESLAQESCLVVSDDFPCFFHPKLYSRIVAKWNCAVELVDSNGIMPVRAAERTFTVAHSYRRHMQKEIGPHLLDFPEQEPLKKLRYESKKSLTESFDSRWHFATAAELAHFPLNQLAIDHQVKPTSLRGGMVAASETLSRFISKRLATYSDDRNEPSKYGSSNLSPYLHFGHVSAHEVFEKIVEHNHWNPSLLSKPNGKMTGFWNLSEASEAFVDQLLTWREIGFNMCVREPNYDHYESLPEWAQRTLADHSSDRREYLYSLDDFEAAKTHDELWNAAQRQLVCEGIIHNYLRMLWGKKILHWSASPQEALRIMIHLNNKYALDGRDPNSYSGIFWVLGRYDRAWGPERPIFGKIRYMTSDSTRSKFRVQPYIDRYR